VSRGRRVAVPPSSPVEVLPSIQVVDPAFEEARLVYWAYQVSEIDRFLCLVAAPCCQNQAYQV
jgi:hypothetical protein